MAALCGTDKQVCQTPSHGDTKTTSRSFTFHKRHVYASATSFNTTISLSFVSVNSRGVSKHLTWSKCNGLRASVVSMDPNKHTASFLAECVMKQGKSTRSESSPKDSFLPLKHLAVIKI
ncbi:hypothetical protein AVEN_165200-1 [Araneus ventricosus]|uniref:Uncharacterized protein n=1 Tax=Araneus ventricosus TaxID=182803 RepID=A0A4Y2B6G5_ARAVE|nr:hypothetical protein AVEN_165200-1 [Araneus ventricosus]